MRIGTLCKVMPMAAASLLVGLVGCEGEFEGAASDDSSLVFRTPSSWSAWSEPVPVTELNTALGDGNPCLSHDGLAVYFNSNRTGTLGNADLWVAHRPDKDAPWGTPVHLGDVINTSADDQGPTLSQDGLVLVFLSNRAGGFGETDLYVSRRTDPADDFGWGPPENMGAYVNTSEVEQAPHLQKKGEDGNPTLYFGRGTPQDIFAARVSKDGEVLEAAVALDELNSSSVDVGVSMSVNGLELYFHSGRPGGFGTLDIYVSIRAGVHDAWGEPQNLGALVNSTVGEFSPHISADGRTLLFTAALRPGGQGAADTWMSTRTPVGNGGSGVDDGEDE